MRYTIEAEENVKKLAAEGKDLEYISSATGIPKKVIWSWCPDLRPHEDVIKTSVKQRYHSKLPDYEGRISSAFSPYTIPNISDDKWDELNKVIYDTLFDEAVYVFKNAISDPPTFSEFKKLSSDKILDYLKSFWSENSEYVKTREVKDSYLKQACIAIRYWSPLRNKLLRDVTSGDVALLKESLENKKLSPSRIAFILRIGLIPLKYAFKSGLTLIRAYDFPSFSVEKTKFSSITREKAQSLFFYEWPSEMSLMANYVAYVTGFRLNEVRALRLSDFDSKELTVTSNNIYTFKKGLTENKKKRVVRLSPKSYSMITRHVYESPYNPCDENDFIFFSVDRDIPCDSRNWTRDLKDVCENNDIDSESIDFSIWTRLNRQLVE